MKKIKIKSLLKKSYSYKRSQIIDATRGLAILLMIVFHFAYSLTFFELADIPLYEDDFWINLRFCILTLFLSSVGISLYLHWYRGLNLRSYIRRIIFITLSALLITLASYLIMPDQYIYFGILHLIAVSSVLALVFLAIPLKFQWINLILGILILISGLYYENPVFNKPALSWIGFKSIGSESADFTPIFPWFGMILLGIFLASSFRTKLYFHLKILRALALPGRYSLVIYLIHQPIIWFFLYIYIQIFMQ